MQIPRKWSEFLSENANKQDLFVYLLLEMKKFNFPIDKEVNATYNDVVLSSNRCYPDFSPCNYEEADTRLIVHVIDALKYEHRSIEIRTVDTDVVVVVIGLFHKLHRMYEDMDIWIKFGVG